MINKNKFTIEDFIQRIDKINYGWNYEIVSFDGYKQPCQIKCLNCGIIIKLKKASDLFKKVNPCKCKKIFKDYHDKMKFLSRQYNFDILFDGKATEKVKVKCNKCGCVMERNHISILNTPWHCDNCNNYNSGKIVYIKEDVQKKLNKQFNNEYELLEYTGVTKKALLRHKNCGKIFTIRELKDLFNGRNRGCPVCYQFKSAGERKIMLYLERNNIKYIPQKTFSPLNKRTYRFDFYLPELNLAIEYQGEQHYKENTLFKDSLEVVKKRDKIKKDYCENNGITLKEIPYTELKNIDYILDSMFNDYRKYQSEQSKIK